MKDLMSNLFSWDLDLFLQSLFLRLDTASLKRCREVSDQWRRFIDLRVWGCQRYRAVIIRKLWSDFDPEIKTFNLRRAWNEKITSVCCDDDIIFCGYSSGICRLFNIETGDEMTSLDDTSSDISYSNCKVHIGKDIIVKISFGYSESEGEGRCQIGIWSKVSLRKLFRTVHRNRNMCFFLKVIDNTIIVREGRDFCKITILGNISTVPIINDLLKCYLQEDCSIKYKALHHLERMMKGDFLANNDYIVSRHGDIVTFLPLSHTHQTSHISVTENIVDSCLKDDLLFLLHETSISVYDLSSRKWKDRILMIAPKLVAIEVNEDVIIILDSSNTVHVLNFKDVSFAFEENFYAEFIFSGGILSCSKIPDDSQTSFRLPFPSSLTSYPSISLNRASLTAFNYNLDQCFLYSLWPHKK